MSSIVESRARLIAAGKMGLVKDVTGANLPDDLWQQCIPQAERELTSEAKDVICEAAKTLIEGMVRNCSRRTYERNIQALTDAVFKLPSKEPRT